MSIHDADFHSHPCHGVNSDGTEYLEFACLYKKTLGPFYFGFETHYDPNTVLHWMQQHSYLPVTVCALYGVLIVAGQRYFATRAAWHWRKSLMAWNLFLAVFSGIGMARTIPHLLHDLITYSLRDNMCVNPVHTCGSGSTGLWIMLFILSKFPELLDTFFIVIHKKPLIFLHWYHHITVLLYCWHSYVTRSPPGVFFAGMNYSVHACMYFYYFLMAARIRPKWFNPMIITALQISQMVVGVAVTLASFYYFRTDPQCAIVPEINTAAFVMYGSYLMLFLQFFVGRYYNNHTSKHNKNNNNNIANGNSIGTKKVV